MTDPELPWWAKLRRAEALVDEINRQVQSLNRPGVGWRIDVDHNDRTTVWSFHELRAISADLTTLVSDAIHNLRSALEQVAYHLAVQHFGALGKNLERLPDFPVCLDPAAFDTWATGKRAGVTRRDLFGDTGIQAVRSVQPFTFAEQAAALTGEPIQTAAGRPLDAELSNDTTHVLHTLWNIDKHRRLPELAWVLRNVAWAERDDESQLVTPSGLHQPLYDGAILATAPWIDDRGVHLEFDIDLLDSPADGPQPLVYTLKKLRDALSQEVIPSVLIVADGNDLPPIIKFTPPQPQGLPFAQTDGSGA